MAWAFGVGWNTVTRAVVAAADLVAPVRPTRVGIDETVMVTGRVLTRRREFLTALVWMTSRGVVEVDDGSQRLPAAYAAGSWGELVWSISSVGGLVTRAMEPSER